MKEYKGIIIALIAGVCAIICCYVFSGNLVDYKRTSGSGGLTATGSTTTVPVSITSPITFP